MPPPRGRQGTLSGMRGCRMPLAPLFAMAACTKPAAEEMASNPWLLLEPGEPALETRNREESSLTGAPPDCRVERLRAALPPGQEFELLVLRPAGDRAVPSAVVGERAIHGPAQALADLAPLAATGHALVAGEFYASPLPAEARALGGVELEVWRQERAVLRVVAALRWLARQPWCDASRRYVIGASRGAAIVAAAAAREPGARAVVLVVPVPWAPATGWQEQVPPERRESATAAAERLRLQTVLPRIAGRGTAVVAAREDPGLAAEREAARLLGPDGLLLEVDAGHRFPFALAWEAGLQNWLLRRLSSTPR